MRGFCTKYATTKGILEVEAVRSEGGFACRWNYKQGENFLCFEVTEEEFFESRSDAEDNARQRAQTKLFELRESVKNMEHLTTTPKWSDV